jgi:autoinducer 2-degrading protein
MTKVLLVDFEVDPVHADEFAAAIAVNARTSVAGEPGCRQFDVCRDPADAARFFFYEVYEDEAAIAAHLGSAHFKVFDDTTRAWEVAKTVRTFDRTLP